MILKRKAISQQQLAARKWNAHNMRTVTCSLRRETAEQFEQYAEKKGLTRHQILKVYVEYLLTGGDGGGPVPLKPDTLLPLRLDTSAHSEE